MKSVITKIKIQYTPYGKFQSITFYRDYNKYGRPYNYRGQFSASIFTNCTKGWISAAKPRKMYFIR